MVLLFKFQVIFLFFINFKSHYIYKTDVKVVNQYKKRNYWVLKLKNREFTFYTTSRDNLKNLLNENLRVSILTKDVSFKGYLTSFYAPTFDLRLYPVSKVEYFIEKQHKNKELASFYKALYFGDSISHSLREKISALGIAHLVALSGLHLGFISLFLYFIFSPVYSFFHRFFPYRNRLFDIGVLVLVVEFLYLFFTDFPPSLIRAFVLEAVLFFYAVRLKDIFSLEVLGVSIFLSFLLFGFKIFSIGYFLSVAGVFYIYLFFKYFKPTFLNSVVLSFYLFVVMFIVSHYFFGYFNFYQFFSPIVSLLFSIFYPISIILHLLGIGGIFDNILLDYFSLGKDFVILKVPLFIFIFFLILSFFAYFNKKAFWGLNLFSIGVILYLVGG